jgi:hypothetical protein
MTDFTFPFTSSLKCVFTSFCFHPFVSVRCLQHATYTPVDTRSAFFWVITQQVVVIPYRRFGTTYGALEYLEDETDRLYQNVGEKLLLLAA